MQGCPGSRWAGRCHVDAEWREPHKECNKCHVHKGDSAERSIRRPQCRVYIASSPLILFNKLTLSPILTNKQQHKSFYPSIKMSQDLSGEDGSRTPSTVGAATPTQATSLVAERVRTDEETKETERQKSLFSALSEVPENPKLSRKPPETVQEVEKANAVLRRWSTWAETKRAAIDSASDTSRALPTMAAFKGTLDDLETRLARFRNTETDEPDANLWRAFGVRPWGELETTMGGMGTAAEMCKYQGFALSFSSLMPKR